MARQPNHHHHHHHVSSTSTSSATPARLFDLPNPYVGYGGGGNGASSSYGSYLLPFASSSSSHVRPTTTTTQLLSLPLLPTAAITPLRLTGREDSTRVRLQRQRVGEQYNRRNIVGDRIPGFKTSAGELFFPLSSFLFPLFLLAIAIAMFNRWFGQLAMYRSDRHSGVQRNRLITATHRISRTSMHNEYYKKPQPN